MIYLLYTLQPHKSRLISPPSQLVLHSDHPLQLLSSQSTASPWAPPRSQVVRETNGGPMLGPEMFRTGWRIVKKIVCWYLEISYISWDLDGSTVWMFRYVDVEILQIGFQMEYGHISRKTRGLSSLMHNPTVIPFHSPWSWHRCPKSWLPPKIHQTHQILHMLIGF
jgi:hypothetical protein